MEDNFTNLEKNYEKKYPDKKWTFRRKTKVSFDLLVCRSLVEIIEETGFIWRKFLAGSRVKLPWDAALKQAENEWNFFILLGEVDLRRLRPLVEAAFYLILYNFSELYYDWIANQARPSKTLEEGTESLPPGTASVSGCQNEKVE